MSRDSREKLAEACVDNILMGWNFPSTQMKYVVREEAKGLWNAGFDAALEQTRPLLEKLRDYFHEYKTEFEGEPRYSEHDFYEELSRLTSHGAK